MSQSSVDARLKQLSEHRDDAVAALARLEKEGARLKQEIYDLRSQVYEARGVYAKLRSRLTADEERLDATTSERAAWAQRKASLESDIAAIKRMGGVDA